MRLQVIGADGTVLGVLTDSHTLSIEVCDAFQSSGMHAPCPCHAMQCALLVMSCLSFLLSCQLSCICIVITKTSDASITCC
jgi:hypothetical protein